MDGSDSTVPAADGLMAGVARRAGPSDWPISKYFLVVVVLSVLASVLVLFGFIIGEPWLGAALGGALFGVLVLVRPETGLFVMALVYPFENFMLIGGTSVTKVLGIYTFAVLLIHAFSTRRLHLWVGAFWLALGFALWSVLGVIGAQSHELARSYLLQRFQMVGLLFVTFNLCATRDQARALFWFIFVGALVAASAGFFLAPAAEEVWQVRRLTLGARGMNVGADRFAKEIIPALFLLPFLLSRTVRKYWPALIVGAGIIMVALIESYARAVALGCLLGLAAMLLCYRRWSLGRRVTLAVLAIVLVVGVVWLGPLTGLYGGGLEAKIAEIRAKGLETGGRAQVWALSIRAGIEHLAFGIGVGNTLPYTAVHGHGLIKVSHNDFLTHFAETGLPGVLLYTAFIIAVFARAWRIGEPWLRAGMIGLFVAQVLSSMANPSFGVKGFWLQMGLILLASRLFPAGGAPGREAVASAAPTRGTTGPGVLPAAPLPEPG